MMTELSLTDSFIFGSLISAVDPVATLAIFNALDINPTLYMLVFGESVLNDAVAVVLFRWGCHRGRPLTSVQDVRVAVVLRGCGAVGLLCRVCDRLCVQRRGGWCLCVVKVADPPQVGVVVALFSALVFKSTRLHEFPSLETAAMLVLCYMPYLLAEALELSGIMAILFAGVVMSHYTWGRIAAFR